MGASENTVVVTGENPAILRRTANKLLAIHQQGHQVRVAVLACNDAIDPESVARRAKLAHELLKAVASTRVGRVVLTSGDRVSTDVQRDLLSLAGVLSCKPEGTLATISVTFGASGDPRERMDHPIGRQSAYSSPSNPRPIPPRAPGGPTFGAEMS
jgi:NAD(P)-dependent dehydrogenase (short-subunit alcohol dehydrogenase family)